MLEQVVPKNDASVCPGSQLVLQCVSRGVALVWIINDRFFNFNTISQKGTNMTGEGFFFLLTDANQTMYVSTATVELASSSLNGERLTCTDGVIFVDYNVSVAGMETRYSVMTLYIFLPLILSTNH